MSPSENFAKMPRKLNMPILRTAHYFFLTFGVLALAYVGYVIVEAHAFQSREESKFEKISSEQMPVVLIEGGVIGEIRVPRLNLKAIIVQGDSNAILRHAVGHIPDTALPGEAGNVALAGHRDTFFRPLRHVRVGDAITLKTPNGNFQYQVDSTAVVPASAVEVLRASSGRTLTLITCYPFNFIGAAPDRFVVHARQAGAVPQITLGH